MFRRIARWLAPKFIRCGSALRYYGFRWGKVRSPGHYNLLGEWVEPKD